MLFAQCDCPNHTVHDLVDGPKRNIQGVSEIVHSLARGDSDPLSFSSFCNRILNSEQAAALLLSALPH